MSSIKGRAATEQDALARIYQEAEREGGVAVNVALQRAPDMSVEYSALILRRCAHADCDRAAEMNGWCGKGHPGSKDRPPGEPQ